MCWCICCLNAPINNCDVAQCFPHCNTGVFQRAYVPGNDVRDEKYFADRIHQGKLSGRAVCKVHCRWCYYLAWCRWVSNRVPEVMPTRCSHLCKTLKPCTIYTFEEHELKTCTTATSSTTRGSTVT